MEEATIHLSRGADINSKNDVVSGHHNVNDFFAVDIKQTVVHVVLNVSLHLLYESLHLFFSSR